MVSESENLALLRLSTDLKPVPNAENIVLCYEMVGFIPVTSIVKWVKVFVSRHSSFGDDAWLPTAVDKSWY